MLVDDFVVEERFSIWQKKKVRTIVVNGRSKKSSRRSIAGAIAVAKPYERIELLGGEYFETVSISIPLEIVAAEGEDPRIISRGSCLTITQNIDVYFEHVEFLSKGKSKLDCAVVLLNGKALFFRCKINSVLIGGFAEAVMDNCSVVESYNGYGIQVSGNGGGEIHNCTLSTHSAVCVDIDTKGTLLLRECAIRQPSNGGHCVSVRAIQSFMDEQAASLGVACRNVTVTKCHIYVSNDVFKPKDREWSNSGTVLGLPVCVSISHYACPLFSFNEITHGFFGFIFESAGAAVLEGNCIYNQSNCGILVILEEKLYSFDKTQENLCISHGNVIDRCHIGIDIQCGNKAMLLNKKEQNLLLCQNIPSYNLSFDWFDKLHKTSEDFVLDFFAAKEDDFPVRVHGNRQELHKLKNDLATLAMLVCAGHLRQFGSMCANTEPWQAAAVVTSSDCGLEAVINLLKTTLKVPLPVPNAAESSLRLLKLCGTNGVDILKNRFSACGLCAIRFENNSYGLVENCDFFNCGATAIILNAGAHPVVVGCTFDQSKGAGIFVNNFANPLIIGNTIINSKEHGITFRSRSRGVVMGNFLYGNVLSGVCITGGSSTVVACNIIQLGEANGVMVSGGSKPVILMNNFTANASAHVLVTEYSLPFIASNSFCSGTGSGLRFESCSGGTVLDNTIRCNNNGITVQLDADPYIISNTILNSVRYGVVVENNGLGTFISNEISFSGNCNVFVLEGGSPVFRNNTIQHGHSGGIVILAEGFGILEHNNISNNFVGNVIVLDRFTEPRFIANNISLSLSGCGIICGRGASGFFCRNKIFKNNECGVYVIGGANPHVIKNTILFETNGVIVSDGGCGVFEENDINSSNSFGIIIQLNGNPNVYKNDISKCFIGGILLAANSSGTVYENKLFENAVGVQLGSTLGTAGLDINISVFVSNRLAESKAKSSGTMKARCLRFTKEVDSSASSGLFNLTLVHHNKIYANTTSGVLLEKFSCGILEENTIELNNRFGVMADVTYSEQRVRERIEERTIYGNWKATEVALRTTSNNLFAVIRKNLICYHKEANIAILNYNEEGVGISSNNIFESPKGIYVANDATIHIIENNNVYKCLDGVYAESGGSGCFENNRIYECSGAGVYVCNSANPHFKKGNVIERCKVSGVFVDAGGRGIFTETTIRHCTMGVVVLTCLSAISSVEQEEDFAVLPFVTSAPTFKQCVIEANALHGVLVLCVSSDILLRCQVNDNNNLFKAADGVRKLPGMAIFPQFIQNDIRNNRHFGVCHELYQFLGTAEKLDSTKSEKSLFFEQRGEYFLHNTVQNQYSLHDSIVEQSNNSYNKLAVQELMGTSTVFSSKANHDARMRRQVSFVENTISNSSIGVVVGSDCHPFFFRNQISNNVFFGIFLRVNSKAVCFGCDVKKNGIAGLYSAHGALGTFTAGVLQRNNGFCRSDGNPHDPRSFKELFFTQTAFPYATTSLDFPLAVLLPSSFSQLFNVDDNDEPSQQGYKCILQHMEGYAFLTAEGLHVLCELVAASSACLSVASNVCPGFSHGSDTVFSNSSHADKHAHGWGVDGGVGAWLAQGSMTEIKDSVVEGNRNIGVFYSYSIAKCHQIATSFPVHPIGGFPNIPGGEFIFGNSRAQGTEKRHYMFFVSTCVHINQKMDFQGFVADMDLSLPPLEMKLSSEMPKKKNFESNMTNSSYFSEDVLLFLRRPAIIVGNTVKRNGCGILVNLQHALKADELKNSNVQNVSVEKNMLDNQAKKHATKKVKRRGGKNVAFSRSESLADSTSSTAKIMKQGPELASSSPNVVAVSHEPQKLLLPLNLDGLQTCVNIDENNVFENYGVGIFCLHVVEVFCGHVGITQLHLDNAAAEYNDVSVKITLKNCLLIPKLLFTLSPKDHVPRHARLFRNVVSNNISYQVLATSYYIAVSWCGTRTMLRLDTLHQPSASMFSSQALLRISLFSSLMMTAPPGMFFFEENRICDSVDGIYVVGFMGERSLCLQKNTFTNIANSAILLEGHLTSATIGKGNFFGENGVSVRIVLPDGNMSKEEVLWQQSMGVTTRICANRFSSPKFASLVVEGGGNSPSPIILNNEFTSHVSGSTACFISGSFVCMKITENKFVDSYVPVIITNHGDLVVDKGSFGSVTLEGNCFSRNYIGLLVCGGAAPKIVRNVFENNYRAGLEVAGESTRATVQQCFFLNNRRNRRVSVSALSDIFFSYPKNGELRLNKLDWFSVSIVPDNSFLFSETIRMPCGILLDGEGENIIDCCLFKGNDIGVDVCSLHETEIVKPISCMCFNSCLFVGNRVAGVLVRGVKERRGMNLSLSATLGIGLDKSGDTMFKQCFFLNNVNNDEASGDVVSINHGCAVFYNCFFTGCVHGKSDGSARFVQNTFKGEGESAVYLHKGTRVQMISNVIRGYKNGVITFPGAWGHVEKNMLIDLTHCVVSAPYCNTFFLQNRMIKATTCGVLAYGGVFTENEICNCLTGVIVRNPIEYQKYESILPVDKAVFDALISDNRIHSCEGDGILVAGGARIERNSVFFCKTNINVTCPQDMCCGEGVANISNNALFDGNVGLVLEKNSKAAVVKNDIFDNNVLAVWIKAGAVGTLRENAISSSMRYGALEVEVGSEMNLQQNVIRNQFSPSYNKTLRPTRERERQKAVKALEEELQKLDNTLNRLVSVCEETEIEMMTAMKALQIKGQIAGNTLTLEGVNMHDERPITLSHSCPQESTADAILNMPTVVVPDMELISGNTSFYEFGENKAATRRQSEVLFSDVEN